MSLASPSFTFLMNAGTLFTVLFAIPRTAGWLAHWQELLGDKDQKISRPRQWYTGVGERQFVPLADR